MPDLGDLEHLLKDESSSLSDLDWLDVDGDDYREVEELPNQNLDAVPDLKEEWGRRDDIDGKYNLAPINKKPEKGRNTSFWSENDTKTGLSDAERSEIAERFLKRKMTAGYSAKDALEIMKNEFSGETLEAARPNIKEAVKEEGLLGRVYIDSSLFSDCDQGQGQDFVRKNASDAKYVIGKDDCHDCVFNKNGVCSRFEKEIVFDVEYNEDLWKFYKRKFEEEGRDLSDVDKGASPKQKIKQAATSPVKDDYGNVLDGKPVREHPADKITSEEADEEVSKMEAKQEIIQDVYKERKEEKVAKKMMASASSEDPIHPTLKDQLESDPELSDLAKEANLLGPLYVDLSYFETKEGAKNFFENHGVSLKDKVVVGTPKESSDKGRRSPLKTKKALNRILHRYAVNNFGSEYGDKKGKLKKIGKRLIQDEDRFKRFARGVFSEPLPQKTATYDSTGQTIYDESDRISKEEAWEELKDFEVDTSKVASTDNEVARRNEVAQKMMEMDYHDEGISEIVRSSDSDVVASLKEHIHLLGSLYKDSSFFSDRESYREFLSDNPDLKELPDRNGESLSKFLDRKEVKDRISSRLAQFDRKELPDKESLSSRGPHGLAQEVFSRNPSSADKEYEGKVYKTTDQVVNENSSMSEKQAKEIISNIEDPEKVEDFNFRSFVASADNGKEVLSKLIDRFGEEPVKTFYLDNDTVTSSKISNNRKEMRSVLSSTLDPNFKPKGLTRFPGELTKTKVGEWMRDAYLEGKSGRKLASDLKNTFSNRDLLENAPVIATFREEEGLYGRTYVTADSFDECVRGKKDLPDTVRQIVKTGKCEGCIHNRESTCGLYQKKLVDEPEYNSDTVQLALKNRMMNGELTRREAKAIQNADLPWKEKTRIAHVGKVEPNKEASISAPYSGYYGDTNKDAPVKKNHVENMVRFAARKAKSGKYDKYGLKKLISNEFPPEVIQKGSKGIKKVLSEMGPSEVPNVIDHDSSDSPSGTEMLDEFEMRDSSSQNDPIQDIELRGDNKEEKMEGVAFGGLNFEFDN